MIVVCVVALDVLDAVKKKKIKILHNIWKYLGFKKNIVIDLKKKKTQLIKKFY
jgi:hypothetical protein